MPTVHINSKRECSEYLAVLKEMGRRNLFKLIHVTDRLHEMPVGVD